MQCQHRFICGPNKGKQCERPSSYLNVPDYCKLHYRNHYCGVHKEKGGPVCCNQKTEGGVCDDCKPIMKQREEDGNRLRRLMIASLTLK